MRTEEQNRQLAEYFKRNLKKGYTEESLKFALMRQGYSRTAVEQAIEQAHKELSEKAPLFKEKPMINYEVVDEKNQPVKLKKSFFKKIKDWLW
ncbi:MAG: hypothetical protein WC812_04385 [Candidatus Pacearchaeota archaeon]|jgi:SOS response regulatory protein OraA/RecX